MRADDPRHGTEAGHEQHGRDDEDPCQECARAKLLAGRRRYKRKSQGFRYTTPAGKAWDRVQRWRAAGASMDDIAELVGIDSSVAFRVVTGDRNQPIYARTFVAIMRAEGTPLTSIGATRRIRALIRLGYSVDRIANEAGVDHDTILDGREPREFVARRVRQAIAEAYDRLHMVLPTGDTQQYRAGITRARNYAEKRGWPPPLAWDDIDDALEQPHGWQYGEPDRAEHLAELDSLHVGITAACADLGISRRSLEKWCARNDLTPLYSRMVAREQPKYVVNQHMNGGAA